MSQVGRRPDGLPEGYLAILKDRRRALVVGMGEVRMIRFNQAPAIGTYGLGSCSVVAVWSADAAILAHIPPNPSNLNLDSRVSEENVRAMMREVKRIRDENSYLFPTAGTTIICGRWWHEGPPMSGFETMANGARLLPDQVDIMKRALTEMGYGHEIIEYNVPPNRTGMGAGTAIVVNRGPGQRVAVYLDDQIVVGR
ncbi:uncharacterized protein DSM5745_09464 [Aspergillus mulundensis]|uniref:Uncharacterized protein n=1 Tax=Aspergillus mulundensis TaxID=1810919 RepID=A0A3D8QVC8_9EURO|nr:hypothetical protein DSM5745_09464 [Aspergillus mulundensis]RDW65725.1 hypothetical protein DSM5745_09464 [Aspergillus mulundensis]